MELFLNIDIYKIIIKISYDRIMDFDKFIFFKNVNIIL